MDRHDDISIDLTTLAAISIEAGNAIMTIRDRGFDKSFKSDGSPVTEADLAADTIINTALESLTPDIPRITEETWADDGQQMPRYWCVDPLDGTKGFINGGRDFTVNIALVDGPYPSLGIIYAPALGKLWVGGADQAWMCTTSPTAQVNINDFSEKTPLKARPINRTNPTIVATKAHRSPALERWISNLDAASSTAVGSSLKFCELATGHADLYPRIGPTMEWDTAAGQAILEAAGGTMIGVDGNRFAYGKEGCLNTPFSAMGMTEGDIPQTWFPPLRHA